MTPEDEARRLREALVESLRKRGELADPRLAEAFLAVPRHVFLPDVPLERAYADEAIPVKHDLNGIALSSASQPTMMALMLWQLRLEPGHNVLEIGAGTGYNAAIIQYLVGRDGHVTTLEIDKDLAQQVEHNLHTLGASNIRVVHTDAAMGYAPRAAYDRVIATAGVWDVPKAWFDQLKPRGIVVAPIWVDSMQLSAAFTRQDDGTFYSGRNLPCGFIHLRGTDSGPGLSMQVGHSALMLMADNVRNFDTAALHTLLSDDGEFNRLQPRLDASEYLSGFLPFLILNLPDRFSFAAYHLVGNQQAYGLSGNGFAVLGTGSACFVPATGQGETIVYGAPDAFMALQETIHSWERASRPGARALRLRLIPKSTETPSVSTGRVYEREYHYLHVWQTQ